VFLALNEVNLVANVDDAVGFMLGIAAGGIDEEAAETWIRQRIEPTA
jgi:prophage maintenance system killer protein